MNWTSGTWADVAIGDTVLGGDGYPWNVVGIEYRYSSNGDDYRAVDIERDGRSPARSSVRASKPVKYQKAEPATVSAAAATPDDAEREAWIRREAEETGESIEDVRALLADIDPIPAATTEPKPYVEYSDAERTAAANLKAAGFTMEVIERVMTLDGLTEHISGVHGHDVPGQNELTRIEYRARLADLHFDLHLRGQERNRKWEPRGRTPHVHPVMDRPMDVA